MKFGSICVWISFIFGITSIIAPAFIFSLSEKGKIPSISNFQRNKNAKKVFRTLSIISSLSLSIIGVYSIRYFYHLSKRNTKIPKQFLIFKQLVNMLHCTSSIMWPTFYFVLAIVDKKESPIIHLISVICFIMFMVLFHFTTDFLYAISRNQMMKLSWEMNLLFVILLVSFGFFALMREIIQSSRFVKNLAHLSQLALIIAGFVKLLFTGAIVLGSSFINFGDSLFHKEKQTIFTENFCEA